MNASMAEGRNMEQSGSEHGILAGHLLISTFCAVGPNSLNGLRPEKVIMESADSRFVGSSGDLCLKRRHGCLRRYKLSVGMLSTGK